MLSCTTLKAVWVVFQMVDAIGRGLLLPTVLPAIMASLPRSNIVAATGMHSFLRSFGFVWGVTIPGTTFNTQFDCHASRIRDVKVRQELGSGRAYQSVSRSYLKTLSPTSHREVLSVYQDALKAVRIAALAFGATGFVAVAIEKHIPLRTELDTKYGMEDEKSKDSEEEKGIQAVRISIVRGQCPGYEDS
jgi:hypothetical protein